MGILRFLLALTVILSHAGPITTPVILGNDGGLAVSAFFIISGFYMSLIAEKYQLHTRNIVAIKNFYLSRFSRIYSVYFLCLILTLILYHFHLASIQNPPWLTLTSFHHVPTILIYLGENLFLFGQDWLRLFVFNGHHFVFDPTNLSAVGPNFIGSSYAVLGQAWSLASELTFYLLVPFLLTQHKKTIALICLSSFILGVVLFPIYGTTINIFFPVTLGLFLLGTLSHQFIYTHVRHLHVRSSIHLCTKIISSILIAQLTVMLFYGYAHAQSLHFSFWLAWWGFLLLIALTVPFLFLYCRHSKIDRYIGELSFPIYMSHLFCLGLAGKFFHSTNIYYGILLTVIVSIMIIRWVVGPLDDMRYKYFLRVENKDTATITSSTTTVLQNST